MTSFPLTDQGNVADAMVAPLRIEEAALNALQTQRQLFFDGWLVRLSPGAAKRARSVNPHFGSSMPVEAKVDRCEAIYAAHRLPVLFRITPFCKPPELDEVLARRGYVAFDATLVQVARLAPGTAEPQIDGVDLASAPVAAFVEAVGELRGSTPVQRAAHFERLSNTPLDMHAVIARCEGRIVGCGQVALDDGLAAIYDMVTAADFRGRGLATWIVAALSKRAGQAGARYAFLQVNDDNAPARAVYGKFGFATVYAYHYRARPSECF